MFNEYLFDIERDAQKIKLGLQMKMLLKTGNTFRGLRKCSHTIFHLNHRDSLKNVQSSPTSTSESRDHPNTCMHCNEDQNSSTIERLAC